MQKLLKPLPLPLSPNLHRPPPNLSLRPFSTTTHHSTLPKAYLNNNSKPLPPLIQIPESDLIEKFLKGSGPGGQKINKTASAVQLKHIPTGIVQKSQATRSRSQNRKICRRLLAERLEVMEKGDESRVRIREEKVRKRKERKRKRGKKKYGGGVGKDEGEEDEDEDEDEDEEGEGDEELTEKELKVEIRVELKHVEEELNLEIKQMEEDYCRGG